MLHRGPNDRFGEAALQRLVLSPMTAMGRSVRPALRAPLEVFHSFSFADSGEVKQAEKLVAGLLAPKKRPGDVNE